LLAAFLAALAVAAPASVQSRQLSFRPFASGLEALTSVATTPAEPNRVYVTTRRGRVLFFVNGRYRGVFLDLEDRVASFDPEQGLLSIAFHPNYKRNHRFYVYYTDFGRDVHVVEFRSKRGHGVKRTARRLLFVDHPETNHNGGQLAFDRGGLLYAGVGDGGQPGDPNDHAQNIDENLGKLIRIDPLRQGARWEIVGLGLRNPWRFSFDRANGDLYLADVGTSVWEEIDYRPRAQIGTLANYGWRLFEGPDPRFPDSPRGPGALVRPVHWYNQSDGSCAIVGGYVYHGRAVAAARGRYFFGDYCSGFVWSMRVVNGAATDVRREVLPRVRGLTSFGVSPAGELFLVTDTGRILLLKK
jgi:glucose/arabinose dehydrogenase